MNTELKGMLQSVIHEAIQPLNERFDKVELRFDALETRFDKLESRFEGLESRFDKFELKFDQFEAFTRNKFMEIDAKLVSISDQVASNTECLVELKHLMDSEESFSYRLQSIESRVNELTIDVKVLKKAIIN